MAQAEKLIPHILKWETGCIKTSTETYDAYFERCRKKGWANDPLDKGGATMCGLTLSAYKAYCKAHKISEPNSANLKAVPYSIWLAIFKEMYWNRWKGDDIKCQSVANILVDYVWGSGVYGITKVQKELGLKADGIVGAKTLAAVNNMDGQKMFLLVKQIRINHYNAIVKANPSQKKWLKGWLNRVNDIRFNG